MTSVTWAFLAWCYAHPLVVVSVLSYLEMFASNLARQTNWRWAEVLSNVLGALPSISPTRLATAASKKPPAP